MALQEALANALYHGNLEVSSDLRQEDERWQLKRGVLYWVRVDKVRRKPGDDRAWLRAVTAPVKAY